MELISHQSNKIPNSSTPPSLSRYENQKRRDWSTFCQYLRNHHPPLSLPSCSGAHVLEFLRYLDQFGKTKVHHQNCAQMVISAKVRRRRPFWRLAEKLLWEGIETASRTNRPLSRRVFMCREEPDWLVRDRIGGGNDPRGSSMMFVEFGTVIGDSCSISSASVITSTFVSVTLRTKLVSSRNSISASSVSEDAYEKPSQHVKGSNRGN